MLKFLLLLLSCAFLALLVCAQTNQLNYHVSIDYGKGPGLFGSQRIQFRFHEDTLSARNYRPMFPYQEREGYDDTTFYLLNEMEVQKIITTIQSFDTLESVINPCILDGLIIYFVCSYNGVDRTAWVGNAYYDKVFFFVDMINKHVPPKNQLLYDKEVLITGRKKCLDELDRKRMNYILRCIGSMIVLT